MSAAYQPTSEAGKQLYNSLPEVYRTRDSGDLARFVDACGALLDRIRLTLDQCLADCFPDTCQPWLLPYFAQLLDVTPVSPDERGRREEVARAVDWRQRKGTLNAIEQIAQAVGQVEVEVQEGWRRTAATPRIGFPRLPAAALGDDPAFDGQRNHASFAARHPDLPAVTPDLRYHSSAVRLDVAADDVPSNPAARLTTFAGQSIWWRQMNPHGAPCFGGSYEDVSRRTVDLRTPDWRQGHIHPKRILLHTPPPVGFFEMGPYPGDVVLSDDREHVLEGQVIDGTLSISAGSLTLRRCAVRRLVATMPRGALDQPVVAAVDCLFDQADISGLARFEYCTALGNVACGRLQASDSLFAGSVALPAPAADKPHCVRFSRIPRISVPGLLSYRTIADAPIFWSTTFTAPGCAVLHPAAPASISFGAEDGGEMGCGHRRRYSALAAAVLEKLKEYLPVGIEAVLVPDARLREIPRAPCPTS